MSVHDALTLSPLQKWRRHGRPPWKLAVHISLAVALTAFAVMLNRQSTFHREMHSILQRMFVSPALVDANGGAYASDYTLLTYSAFQNQLNHTAVTFLGGGGSTYVAQHETVFQVRGSVVSMEDTPRSTRA